MGALRFGGALGLGAFAVALAALVGCSGEADSTDRHQAPVGVDGGRVAASGRSPGGDYGQPDPRPGCGPIRDRVTGAVVDRRCPEPPTEPVDPCGKEPPAVGVECSVQAKCLFDNGCGGTDIYWCDGRRGGVWDVLKGTCVPQPPEPVQSCGKDPPPVGLRCDVQAKCVFDNGCGGMATYWCDGRRDGVWQVDKGTCQPEPPPPPPEECGKEPPTAGDLCKAPLKCPYVNACGATDVFWCDGLRWQLEPGVCPEPPGPSTPCAKEPPTPGTRCEGLTRCTYDDRCGGNVLAWCDSKEWHVESKECPLR